MWLIVFSFRTILEGTPECLKTLQEHRGLNRRPLLLSKNQYLPWEQFGVQEEPEEDESTSWNLLLEI